MARAGSFPTDNSLDTKIREERSRNQGDGGRSREGPGGSIVCPSEASDFRATIRRAPPLARIIDRSLNRPAPFYEIALLSKRAASTPFRVKSRTPAASFRQASHRCRLGRMAGNIRPPPPVLIERRAFRTSHGVRAENRWHGEINSRLPRGLRGDMRGRTARGDIATATPECSLCSEIANSVRRANSHWNSRAPRACSKEPAGAAAAITSAKSSVMARRSQSSLRRIRSRNTG